MRIVGEIPHEKIKITIFSWNNKYLLKLEKDNLEQTFKVSEMDVTGDEDLKLILNEKFLEKAMNRFEEMRSALNEAMGEIEY